MSRRKPPVAGFCYRTKNAITLTPKEWQQTYRDCRRVATDGETAYYLPAPLGGRVAEAYAIIPEAR